MLCALLAASIGCKGGDGDEKRRGIESAPAPAAGATAAADAAPLGPPPPAYRAALRRGRELMRGGQPARAAEAFAEAESVIEGDPRALSELSWALFHARDYRAAAAAARRSIAGAAGKLKAASLYERIVPGMPHASGEYDPFSEDPDITTSTMRFDVTLGADGTLSVESESPVNADYRGQLGEARLRF